MTIRVGKAFSLIELIVVIGLIAIFVALLLPALSQARRSEQAVRCRANLREVGQALRVYANENDGWPYPVGRTPAGAFRVDAFGLPVPPHERERSVPERASAIVMKLLAKSAEDRYPTAEALAADLADCLRWLERSEREAGVPAAPSSRISAPRMPRELYGRARPIGELLAALNRAARGGAELVLISGEAGIGKSALGEGVKAAVAERGGYFAAGQFQELRRVGPGTAHLEHQKPLLAARLRACGIREYGRVFEREVSLDTLLRDDGRRGLFGGGRG
jgi:hypothetical protein